MSPGSRVMSNTQRLSSIAEDENNEPLSHRRDGAPTSIDLPGRPPVPALSLRKSSRSQQESSVSFDGDVQIEEIPLAPPATTRNLSPPPLGNRVMAGHTPMKTTRTSTPPPQDMNMDGMEDTPTRNNTQMNVFLTRSNDEEEDMALRGPLNLPELPNKPDDTNFTLEALSKRLERIEMHPEEGKPMVFSQPTPGVASPASPVEPAGTAQADNKYVRESFINTWWD